MSSRCYKLEGKKVVACKMREMNLRDNRVNFNIVGGVEISTVFLGIDHGCNNDHVPVVFETMIFGGKHDEYCMRYSTWQDAMAGHKKIKIWIRMEQFTRHTFDFDVAVEWMKRLQLI